MAWWCVLDWVTTQKSARARCSSLFIVLREVPRLGNTWHYRDLVNRALHFWHKSRCLYPGISHTSPGHFKKKIDLLQKKIFSYLQTSKIWHDLKSETWNVQRIVTYKYRVIDSCKTITGKYKTTIYTLESLTSFLYNHQLVPSWCDLRYFCYEITHTSEYISIQLKFR